MSDEPKFSDCAPKRRDPVLGAYLQTIEPWCTGLDGRGWKEEDFTSEVLATRTEFSQTIFPIALYPVGDSEKQFLNPEELSALFDLNQMLTSFNELVRRVNNEHTYPGIGHRLVVLLHVGLIGSAGTGGLFDAYQKLKNMVG